MNRKQLTILIVLVVVVGGLGLVVYQRNNASWQSVPGNLGRKLLEDFPVNDIAHITIKQPQAELNLVKDEIWKVKERYNYPANFSEISGFLLKAKDLKTVQNVKVGPSQFGRLELLAPDKGTNAGTLLEFKDKGGKAIKSLLLGKKYVRESQNKSPMGGGDFPVGRYVMVPGEPQSVSLISDALADIEAKPDRWLSKDFFKVEKLRSISMISTNATNSWGVVREAEAGELKLVDKTEVENIDPSKVSGVGNALSSPSFNDVLAPDAKPEETGMDNPTVATLETFDNFVYTVKIGKKKDDDSFHLKMAVAAKLSKERTPGKDEKPEDKAKLDKEFQEKLKKLEDKLKQEQAFEKWTYLVSKWTIDPLLKERKDFYAEKKEEPKKDDPKAEDLKKDASSKEEPKKESTTLVPLPLPEVKIEEKK